ncbi:putative disease resistance RPP13-like protein 1 [Morella rubra]|uniref:Putative disease resistance RPP13-like protein 1 n=1 Tax=Morella rubra TaxID=262757 RepID=A0A6A1UHN9_9ROSI|nr:putative disease resistance RPP13-like protein 1 [Morella rubra]
MHCSLPWSKWYLKTGISRRCRLNPGKKTHPRTPRKLKIAVLSVNAVLEDAEEKQLTKPFVKDWIDELKDALYDADDILDRLPLKPCDPSWWLNSILLRVRIKRLPKSTCKLINLQTLKLSGCKHLVALPKHMWKLTSLRHLDIAGTGIKKMPEQLGSLKCLNTLTKFVVGKGSGSSIRELGKLKNLQGTLSISKLQNVVPPKDALNAGLKDKKHLEKLALEWDATTPRSESERIVLESLRPHTSLKSLTIKGYGGGIFPDWPFGGLKVLRFEKMSGWEEWLSSSSAENEGGAFPDLKELYIQGLP